MLPEGTCIDPDESLAEREQGLCVLVRNLFLRRVGLKNSCKSNDDLIPCLLDNCLLGVFMLPAQDALRCDDVLP